MTTTVETINNLVIRKNKENKVWEVVEPVNGKVMEEFSRHRDAQRWAKKTKDWVPDLWLYVRDDTEYWRDDIKNDPNIIKILSIYIFDRRFKIHLCSLTPSYDMWFVEHKPILRDDTPDAEIDRIDMLLMEADGESGTYYDCYGIDRMPTSPKPHLVRFETDIAKSWKFPYWECDYSFGAETPDEYNNLYHEFMEDSIDGYRANPEI